MNEFREKNLLFQFLESIFENNADNSSIDKIKEKFNILCSQNQKSVV